MTIPDTQRTPQAATQAEETGETPALVGYHHVDLTVTDIDASEAWYGRVFGLRRFLHEPHPGGGGHAVVLHRPDIPLLFGLNHHRANQGEEFTESRTGLDHVSFAVGSRAELEQWRAHLDRLGVTHSGISDHTEPIPYALLVLRDPDNIQLEIVWT